MSQNDLPADSASGKRSLPGLQIAVFLLNLPMAFPL